MAPASNFSFHLWDPADATPLPAITRLLSAAFGEGVGGTEWFLWKHRDNPLGPSIVCFARDHRAAASSPSSADTGGDPPVVAVRVLWRWDLRAGGQIWTAYQPSDTVTHPDYRRRGLFAELTRIAVAEAKRRGAHVLFNFPNADSAPANRRLGWRDVQGPRTYVRFQRPLRAAARVLGRRPAPAADVAASPRETWGEPPLGPKGQSEATAWAEALENVHAGWDHRITGIRHRSLLVWRFGSNPLRRYTILREEKILVVLCPSVRGRLREVALVDLLGPVPFPASSLRRVFQEIERRFRPDLITTFLSSGHPAVPALLRQGFVPVPRRARFMVRLLTEAFPPPWEGRTWALSGCDTDYR